MSHLREEANYTVNEATTTNTFLHRVVPPVAAVIATVAFIMLGLWQLDRAGQKEQLTANFAEDSPFRALGNDDDATLFERVEVRGRMLGDRQVLVDNIVQDGRIGYFVITPVELAEDDRLLLVNRGWVDKRAGRPDDANFSGVGEWLRFRGRIGRLPRVGIRSGEAFEGPDEWPRVAVYPTIDEVAAELGRDLKPFVLLLDAGEERGFERNWEPAQSGPMTHYGYAFQWFAMALTVVAISGWHLHKRFRKQ